MKKINGLNPKEFYLFLQYYNKLVAEQDSIVNVD